MTPTNHIKAGAATVAWASVILLWALQPATPALADRLMPAPFARQQAIPILGITLDHEWQPVGIVVHVELEVENREDHEGLRVRFKSSPGRFSALSQQAVMQAILRSGHRAGLLPDSWTVSLTFPYEGVTVYGDSLSAMVGLSVVALAKGDPLPPDRVITGTITSQGEIGPVGGVPYKIHAAYNWQFHRVLIPEEYDVTDGDWQTPFLMQVSPVGTLRKAYYGLTGRPLSSLPEPAFPVGEGQQEPVEGPI